MVGEAAAAHRDVRAARRRPADRPHARERGRRRLVVREAQRPRPLVAAVGGDRQLDGARLRGGRRGAPQRAAPLVRRVDRRAAEAAAEPAAAVAGAGDDDRRAAGDGPAARQHRLELQRGRVDPELEVGARVEEICRVARARAAEGEEQVVGVRVAGDGGVRRAHELLAAADGGDRVDRRLDVGDAVAADDGGCAALREGSIRGDELRREVARVVVPAAAQRRDVVAAEAGAVDGDGGGALVVAAERPDGEDAGGHCNHQIHDGGRPRARFSCRCRRTRSPPSQPFRFYSADRWSAA